ncbi:hypothetical protein [Caulobacter vibrioides]|uniref:hypothetical protein n=1 Tax=Caulobacter vibrioides TaxID=155892 RepID=UPI000BB48D81|nr:hypothetical protein [Caulobacter vibrioides]ATC23818.1 hypothetical protein CA608_04355 [Caulobacter vibrioides]PLR15972.1 hypothetical protein CVUC_02450 [Caulobacter vibrioides]
MRYRLNGLVAMLALSVAGAASAANPKPPPEQVLAKMLDGRTAGAPVNCIDSRGVETVDIVDKTAIVYRLQGGRLYVNRPRVGAESLRRDQVLVTRTVGTRLCSFDPVNLLESGARFDAGFVSLGAFTPYDRPRR